MAPGRVNHHASRRLRALGWRAAYGCPGVILDQEGEAVEAHVLESGGLPSTGPGWTGSKVRGCDPVHVPLPTHAGQVTAGIHVLAADLGPPPPSQVVVAP